MRWKAVVLPAVVAGSPRRRAEGRGRDLLDLLGLGDKAKAVPGVLSGGQRQRLAIARALANEPTLLLADEPTGVADSEGGHEVMELLRRLPWRRANHLVGEAHDDDVAACGRADHPDEGRSRAERDRFPDRSTQVATVLMG